MATFVLVHGGWSGAHGFRLVRPPLRAGARRTPHPRGSFVEPVRLGQALETFPFSRTYIRATADDPGSPGAAAVFDRAAAHARSSPAWRYREVATNHMVARKRPAELAGLLLELVATGVTGPGG